MTAFLSMIRGVFREGLAPVPFQPSLIFSSRASILRHSLTKKVQLPSGTSSPRPSVPPLHILNTSLSMIIVAYWYQRYDLILSTA